MSTNDAESPGEEGFLRFWTFVIVLQVGIFIREKLSLSSLYQFLTQFVLTTVNAQFLHRWFRYD